MKMNEEEKICRSCEKPITKFHVNLLVTKFTAYNPLGSQINNINLCEDCYNDFLFELDISDKNGR